METRMTSLYTSLETRPNLTEPDKPTSRNFIKETLFDMKSKN